MAEQRFVGFTQEPGEKKDDAQKAVPDTNVSALSGLVSIIIPCCGMLEYTKLCVPSVLRYSRDPFELIFLDIGSLDGTAEYLAGIQAGVRNRVQIVRAQTDLGIPQVVSQALARAAGEFLVLLNNDTVVTEGWLHQLTALAKMSPAIGMVGPMSNYAAVPQLVESVPYRVGPRRGRSQERGSLVDLEAVNQFARDFRDRNKGNWMEVDRLGGLCLLLKRQVLDKIGSLEKWSDLGLFDTDILSAKTRQIGFTLACCRDLFIHHFGTRTFAHGATATLTAR